MTQPQIVAPIARETQYQSTIFVKIIKTAVLLRSIHHYLECLHKSGMAKWGALTTKTVRINISRALDEDVEYKLLLWFIY